MTTLEIILTGIVTIIVLAGIGVHFRWRKTLNDFYKKL